MTRLADTRRPGTKGKCHCGERAHVRLGNDALVCWSHYNQAVHESTGKVEARVLRKWR